jgi:hypothetical protein
MSNNFLNSERWLETDKFVNYLDNLFSCRSLPRDWKGYLNFFEEVGLFFPVLKIELPEILIRRQFIKNRPSLKDPLLSYDGFEEEEKVWIKLKGAQSNWKNFSTQVEYHPFDEISKTGLEKFFQTKFNKNGVIKNKKVIVGQQCGKPIEDKGIYAYYHYWQLLKFAEIFFRTGIIVHYNSPQKIVFSLEELLKKRKCKSSQRLLGIHALSEFEKLVPIFNAVAFFNAYSDRALSLITRRSVRSRPNLVEGEDFRQLKREEQSIAQEALQRYKVTEEEGHKLIEWLCKQWSYWSKECQLAPIMVEEYKQHILMAIRFYKTLSGKNFSDLINSIEIPITYRKPILRVIFPNKQEDSQEIIQHSLIDWVKPSIDKMNEIKISEQDYVNFLSWIKEKGLFQFHWHFILLGDIWKDSLQVFEFSALYREVIGLGSTLEHIANELIEVRGLGGLNGKLQKIWEENPKVSNTLKKGSTIFPEKNYKLKTCQKLLEDIERTEVEEFEKISKLLHKAIVIRNCGSHGSLKNSETEDMFSQQEQLKEYVLILLQAMIISWKQVFSSSASPSI